MEDLRRDLIRRHKITESEMRRFNQGFKKYVAVILPKEVAFDDTPSYICVLSSIPVIFHPANE